MSNVNDFIVAEGAGAREANEQSNERQKIAYVKLKDGDSLRGYLLVNVSTETVRGKEVYVSDFKMFRQHRDYQKHIHSHACLDPKNGTGCLSCQQGVGRTDITIVPFYDVDSKTIKVFEAKKSHMKNIYGFIDLYGEDASSTPIYFTRNGADKKTSYTVNPTPPNILKKEAGVWERPDDVMDKLTGEFFFSVINPPDEAYLKKLLGLEGVADAEITPIEDDGDEAENPTASF